MTSRRALVVTFDCLPASILGCYGNEWIETPQLDQVAAAGFVADQCWSAHVGPASAETAFAAETGLAALTARQVHTSLLLEDASQTIFSLGCAHQRSVMSGERSPAAKPDCIPLAELIRAALALDSRSDGSASSLCWLHARGLEIPAAPPAGFAELYQDEFEDRGVRFDALSDTERAFHPLAAAGMASLFDHWLGQLFARFAADDQPLLTIVTAAAGAAWQPWPNSFGELDSLRSQRAQVPFLARIASDDRTTIAANSRQAELCSPRLLGQLVEWWFAESDESWPEWLAKHRAERIITTGDSNCVRITTPEWAAIFPPANSGAGGKPLLFRKPEDFWEVNTLADVLPDVVEALAGELEISERGT